jgi:hypothetical protein
MSVCLSLCPCAWDNLAPNGQIFTKFSYLSIFPKSVQIIQVSLKSDKNNRYFTLKPMHIFIIILLTSS